MSLRFRYSDPRGIDEPAAMVSLASNIRWGEAGFGMSAELAQAAVSGVEVDDPGGIYDFVGLRAFEVAETSAPSNNQIIGRFVIQDQTIGRDADRALLTGRDRLWSLDLSDYNWHAGKRILVDADAKRPDETAGDRLRWLINDAAHINLNDYGNVSYPSTNLDDFDFRGQRPIDVLADCAAENGYLFWVDYNEAHGKPELFFLDPDSTTYQATIGVSNDVDDVDGTQIFYPYLDARLVRTPRAIAYGVWMPYGSSNRHVYVRKDSTGEQFAKQDQTAPMRNVRKEARARRIATRFLNQHDEQSERLHFAIKVPWEQVNDVRQGHLMNVRFQHLPGYTAWTGVRVLRKFVQHEPPGGDDYALIRIEAVGPTDGVADVPDPEMVGTSGAILYQPVDSTGAAATDVFPIIWESDGDAPGPGLPLIPIDSANFAYAGPAGGRTGLTVLAASGLLDINCNFSFQDVGSDDWHAKLLLNGVTIADELFTGGMKIFDLNATGVAVVAGDVISAVLVVLNPPQNPAIPAGIGTGAEQLRILNTSLVSA